MSRSEARLHHTIWEGLEPLAAHAKLLYVVLLTERMMNHAGVARAQLDLWAEQAGLTDAEAAKAFAELIDLDYVASDPRTREVLVRTLIRNDGIANQPYMLKGALKEALMTRSPKLRQVLADELRKLPPRRPDSKDKNGKKITYPDPHAAADLLTETHSTGTRQALETLSKGSRQAVDRQAPEKGLDSHSTDKGEGEGDGEGVPVGSNSSRVTRSTRASAAAHQLVNDYARGCAHLPPTTVVAALARHVDALLRDNWPAEIIATALTAWGEKGLGPGAFPSVAHEVGNGGRNGKRLRAVPTIAAGTDPADVELTRDQVNEILGPEYPPNPPDDIAGDVDACKKWWAGYAPTWRADRHAQAVARLAARA